MKTKTAQVSAPRSQKAARRRGPGEETLDPVHAPALVIARGSITAVDEQGRASFRTTFGHTSWARLSQAVDRAWLAAAVDVAPVEAEGTVGADGSASVWAIFPGPAHAEVRVEHRRLEAGSSLSLSCGDSQLHLSSSGRVEIRGKEVLARGSRVARLQGGSVRLG